jgi:hypothetical protein
MNAKTTDTHGNEIKQQVPGTGSEVVPIRPGIIQIRTLPYVWDGDEEVEFANFLIDDMITENTIGLLVAESTGGKTFTANDIAYAVCFGQPFFGKDTEQGGVIYVAAEAAGTIPIRQKAAREARRPPPSHALDIFRKPLPLATITDVPNLSTTAGVNSLIATVQEIAGQMMEHHKLPVRLIIIDTILAAFGLEDWNSAAQVTAVTNAMKEINKATGAAVMGLGHHGKDISRGPAGSFALKANVDFLLTIVVKREGDNPLGAILSRHLIVTKSRDGVEGWQCEFELESVFMGHNRKDKKIYTAVVKPKFDGSRLVVEGAGKKGSRDRPLDIFQEAFNEIPPETVRVRGEATAPEIKAVRRKLVREEFSKRYTTDDEDDQKKAKATKDKAFRRALESARNKWNLCEGNWHGTDWLWRVQPSPAPATNGPRSEPDTPAASAA